MMKSWIFYLLAISIGLLTVAGVIVWSFYGPEAEKAAISTLSQEEAGTPVVP